MNRILLPCLLVLLIAGAATGQTADQSALLCNLSREKAPVIRGVKLGMTSDELHASVPGIRDDYKSVVEQAQKFPHYGETSLGANPRETGKGERFEGIEGFYFHLFDDHVMQYVVYYRGAGSTPRGPTWKRLDDMIARFTEAYHLPGPGNWVATEGARVLKCQGFEVRISNPDQIQVDVREPGNPWAAEQTKRREAYEEQLRREFKP